jgi:hypothetical protein
MNVWNTQSGSSFRYQYGGPASDTATKYDNRNVVFFRNTTNGGAIATTYSWWDSNKRMLDSDIIVWDGGFKFFTGTSGCGTYANAAYLEDVAAHEFGHALGLNHSSTSGATMYSGYSYCSQSQRTLASDDINGAKALYPPSASASANTAPVVSIGSPANGATFSAGSTLSFAGTAADTQDGNISSQLQWTDNGAAAGSGSLLSKVLNVVGTHAIVAKATDSGGLQGARQVSVTITVLASASASTQGTLTATKGFYNGSPRVLLKWTGVSGTSADVYRNGAKIVTTANDGDYTNYPSVVPATYAYKVCAPGTLTCTNTASVTY